MTQRDDLLQWSFIACLIGGILIAVGALGMAAMMGFMGAWMPSMGGGPMPGGLFVGMAVWMAFWGAATAGVAIYAAFRIRNRPDDAMTGGIVAIVAGALAFVTTGGGFALGALAVVLGGILAIVAGQQARAGRAPPATGPGP